MTRPTYPLLRRLLAAGALALIALVAVAPAAAAWAPICATASPPAGWAEESEGPTADGYTRSWGYGGNDTDGPGGTRRDYAARVGFEQAAYGAGQDRITTLQEFLDEFEETQQAAAEEVTVRGNGTTTIGGRSAFYTSWTRRWWGYQTTSTGVGVKLTYQEEAIYLVDLGDSAVALAVTADIAYWGTGASATPSADAEALVAELFRRGDAALRGMTFDWDGCAAGPGTPTPGEALPWQTVAGGAAAVAAAAAALAGVAAGRAGRREVLDPRRPVGHLLEVSADRLDLTAGPADLQVQVWTVLASGQVEPAAAQVALAPPAGVEASALAGAAPLRVRLRQAGPAAPGASVGVTASAGGGSSTTEVALVVPPPLDLIVATVPTGATLRPQGGRALLVRAELRLPPGASADLEPVRATIAFDPPAAGDWLDTGRTRDVPGGRELPVALSSPDPTRQLTPPDAVVVTARAVAFGQPLVGAVTIPVERPPVLDLRPDTLEVAAGSGTVTDVLAWVAEPGPGPWTFGAHWREGDRPVARFEVRPQTASSALIRVTEDAARLPDAGLAEEGATLVVTAAADGWDALARHLRVVVAREGLFLDPVARDADGVVHVDGAGSGRPTEVDVRVYVRDPAGRIVLDAGRSADVTWTPAGPAGSPGRAALGFPEFSIECTGMRPGNRPAATYRLVMGRSLPTSGDPLPASLDAAAPGSDEAPFTATLGLLLDGVDMSPFSPVWQEEQAECLRIIDAYAPRDRQAQLRALVYERGPKVGADTLHELRRKIWSLSENALRAEAEDYLTTAWTLEQAEGVLDWASWCGDIALAVVSGRITGTAAGIAVGLLKPVLVSAITAYLEGHSLEDWAAEQVKLAVSVAEGQFTDPDFLEKISGAHKAKVWALFIAYTFCKEWYLDPEHRIREAALNTVRMLRDQALIHFLRKATGTLPQAPPPEDAAAEPVKKPAKKPAQKPDAAPARPGTPKSRADAMAAEIRAKTSAGKPLERGTLLEILRDPDAMRVLKAEHPDLWQAYTQQRQQIYDAHDTRLKEWLKANPDRFPELAVEGRQVEVEFFGTKTGVDRDYRVGYAFEDTSVTPPRKVFIELKKEKWSAESQRIFAEETGGPTDPKGAARWAKDHQQLATDQYHAEAAVDMADQLRVWNPEAGGLGPDGKPKGGWEQVQVEPRVKMVEDGHGTLLDPDGLGKTYETKVAEAYHEGNLLDAYTQAGKAAHTLEAVRDGYARQHYGIKDLPPKLQAGLDVIKRVKAKKTQPGDLDAVEAEALLRGLDLGGLTDLMERVSGSFGSLRWARRP